MKKLETIKETWADGRIHSFTRVHCDCGETVDCYHFTNTCDCGRDYNPFGQLLAHRSQWGEETGESLQDILNADSGDNWDEE